MNALDSSALVQLGIDAFDERDIEKARKYFQLAVQNDPTNVRAWGWMANTAATSTDRIECLRKALEIDPDAQGTAELLNRLELDEFLYPREMCSDLAKENAS